MDNRDAVNILKDVIRQPYAFPGGYEKVIVTTDGGIICHKCAKEEYYNMLHSTRGGYCDGWAVDSVSVVDSDEVDSEYCCHCGREIS